MHGAEIGPDIPLTVGVYGSIGNDSDADGILCNMELTAESMPCGGVHSCHGCFCV